MPSASAAALALVSLVPFGLGAVCLVFGARRGHAAFRHLSGDHPHATPSPESPGVVTDGHAAVTGTVQPGPAGSSTAPLSGTDAVAYRLRIEERDDSGGWATIAEFDDAARFYLEGSLDKLLVEPSGSGPTVTTSTTVETGAAEPLPAEVRDRFDESDRIDLEATPGVLAVTTDARRRYTEAVLEPGETAYVYGNVVAEPDALDHSGRGRIAASDSSTFIYGTEAAVQAKNDRSFSGAEATVLLAVQALVTTLFGLWFVGFGAVIVSDALALAATGVPG